MISRAVLRTFKSKTAATLIALQLALLSGHVVANEVSKSLDAATFTALNGDSVKITDYRGKVVLVNFWATCCSPCVREMPSRERLYQMKKDEPFEILAISAGETKEQIETFLPKLEMPLSFPILLDTHDVSYSSIGIKGMPTTYVLDHTGEAVYQVLGGKDWDEPAVVEALNVFIEKAKQQQL